MVEAAALLQPLVHIAPEAVWASRRVQRVTHAAWHIRRWLCGHWEHLRLERGESPAALDAAAPSEIPRLIENIAAFVEEAYRGTQLAKDGFGSDGDFVGSATRPAQEILRTHFVLALGQTGSGKSTLVNALCAPQRPPRAGESKRRPGPAAAEPPRPTGLYPLDQTAGVHPVPLRLDGLDGLNVKIVDTEGWTHKNNCCCMRPTSIQAMYRDVLQSESVAGGHAPHVILFCVQVTAFKNFNEARLTRLRTEMKAWLAARRFHVAVVPVATFADTIDEEELDPAKEHVRKLAHDAFRSTGAEVRGVVATSCKRNRPPEGVRELKEAISTELHTLIRSEDFKTLWRRRLAEGLQSRVREHLARCPCGDSEWGLYLATLRLVLRACGKSLVGEEPQGSRTREPPWWVIPLIPEKHAPRCWPGPYISWTLRGILRRSASQLVYVCLFVIGLLLLQRGREAGLREGRDVQQLLHSSAGQAQRLRSDLARERAALREMKRQRDAMAERVTRLQGEERRQSADLIRQVRRDQQLRDGVWQQRRELQKLRDKLNRTRARDGKAASRRCRYTTVTSRCLGLDYVDAGDAEACRSVCCVMGSDRCHVWQFRPGDGCWLGWPDDGCGGEAWPHGGKVSSP